MYTAIICFRDSEETTEYRGLPSDDYIAVKDGVVQVAIMSTDGKRTVGAEWIPIDRIKNVTIVESED